jgi:lysyl-tRNA synthetase class II
MNLEVREVFRRRGRLMRAMRETLDARGYLEVETPVLQPLYGGAFARRSSPATMRWTWSCTCASRTSSTSSA